MSAEVEVLRQGRRASLRGILPSEGKEDWRTSTQAHSPKRFSGALLVIVTLTANLAKSNLAVTNPYVEARVRRRWLLVLKGLAFIYGQATFSTQVASISLSVNRGEWDELVKGAWDLDFSNLNT